ncbi:hypothetical protein CDD82_2639 [Ophiocordyceps australis]|uniref:Uncharacterized protein n=1 Tax=Ophiocordyceps australis TaxID=1399860 RepID=A0A2C5ZRP5_9HYPO|nr:hypothetical protein CDD82_2639 [Ophiocordyceps australis]
MSMHAAAASSSSSSALPLVRNSSCDPDSSSHTQRRHFAALLAPSLAAEPASTSLLVPSTAQGKPIPVDDSTAQHRTSALRRINSHFPSRQRYSKSSSSHSKTYSEPILVRSYHPPAAGRHVRSIRAGPVVSGGLRSGLVSASEADHLHARATRGLLFASQASTASRLSTMARGGTKSSLDCTDQDAQLPPLEAFSFKSFMNNFDQDKGGVGINAHLDRIAEICARSRYSLSNQYEVHDASHGSRLASLNPHPDLQTMSLDEDTNGKKQKKRKHGHKRRSSRAVSTLETIMSSSRSSDEERPRPKPGSNGIDSTRGRASTNPADVKSQEFAGKTRNKRRSTSLALIDSPKQIQTPGCPSSPRWALKTGLIGEPAVPQTSTKQLQIRTAGQATSEPQGVARCRPVAVTLDVHSQPMAQGSISTATDDRAQARLQATLRNWAPWMPAKHAGRAEGSLRHLLKTTDVKGKGVFGMAY